MSSKNLWGDLQGLESVRTPALILQEQAGYLGQLTDEILEGVVHRLAAVRASDRVDADLYIVAPALRRYRVKILSVSYSLSDAYPAFVSSYIEEGKWDAKNEADLEGILEGILSSDNVRRVIFSLIAESRMSIED